MIISLGEAYEKKAVKKFYEMLQNWLDANGWLKR